MALLSLQARGRGVGLLRHQFVALAVILSALTMAAEHPAATGVDELRPGYIAGVGAFLLGVDVLAAAADRGHVQHRKRR